MFRDARKSKGIGGLRIINVKKNEKARPETNHIQRKLFAAEEPNECMQRAKRQSKQAFRAQPVKETQKMTLDDLPLLQAKADERARRGVLIKKIEDAAGELGKLGSTVSVKMFLGPNPKEKMDSMKFHELERMLGNINREIEGIERVRDKAKYGDEKEATWSK